MILIKKQLHKTKMIEFNTQNDLKIDVWENFEYNVWENVQDNVRENLSHNIERGVCANVNENFRREHVYKDLYNHLKQNDRI